jgi:hypothetical protein
MIDTTLALHFARKSFESKCRTKKDSAEKYCWILQHPQATAGERRYAEHWLETVGHWNPEQIAAAKMR